MPNSALFVLLFGFLVPHLAAAAALRVCADPNDLPFSNRADGGFENKIAQLIAADLGETVEYTFAAQHQTFIERTLNAGQCDVVMSVPVGLDEVDETAPYYRSTYVFVSRAQDGPPITSLTDPRLRALRIGVHLIGDGDAPPEIALGEEGIVANVRGYMIYGDYAQPDPPARLVEAVANHQIDVAVVWGPIGGYFARRSPVKLTITPITDTERFAPLAFSYSIAIGVRKGDAMREVLNKELKRRKAEIGDILRLYGVPLADLGGKDG